MGRPRYHINHRDWLDCLDWLDYQCSRSDWYVLEHHPVHDYGIVRLKQSVRDWRSSSLPSESLLSEAQNTLLEVLTTDDWARLRKALSARKRRRKEAIEDSKPVNITLTRLAHQLLTEYKDLSNSSTLSEAIEHGFHNALSEARRLKENELEKTIREHLAALSPKAIIHIIQRYLHLTEQKKTLANSSRFAMQVFNKRKDVESFTLLKERFIDDLVWNGLHLKVALQQLPIWKESK